MSRQSVPAGKVYHAQRRSISLSELGKCCQGEVAPITGQCVMCYCDAHHTQVCSICKRNSCLDYNTIFVGQANSG